MRLAHVVLAHHRPQQLARLVDRLSHPGDAVYVHVDAKQDLAPFTAALGARLGTPGVTLLPRTRCEWGGWGLVRATLDGLAAALDAPEPADRVCLLSGQDYPLRPRAELARRLAGDAVHLDARPLPDPRLSDGGGLDRLERLYLRPSRRWSLPNRFVPFWPRRTLPAGLVAHGGSQFWTLPADVGRWVLDELARRPELERFFRRAFVADEHLIQTLIASGPHAARITGDDGRFVDFDRGTAAHPRTLGLGDLPALLAADALFARKFDADADAAVLDALDDRRGLRSASVPGRRSARPRP